MNARRRLFAVLGLLAARPGAAGGRRGRAGRATTAAARSRCRAPPQRIVSLLPSLTETVCELRRLRPPRRRPTATRTGPGGAGAAQARRAGGCADRTHRGARARPRAGGACRRAPSTAWRRWACRCWRWSRATSAETLRVIARAGAGAGRRRGRRGAGGAHRDAHRGRGRARAARAARAARVYFEVAANPYAAGEASFVGETAGAAGAGQHRAGSRWGRFPSSTPSSCCAPSRRW